ncbi:MAG: hypothetical protein ACRDBG_17525 [Waterburya sp.]
MIDISTNYLGLELRLGFPYALRFPPGNPKGYAQRYALALASHRAPRSPYFAATNDIHT